MGAQVYIVLYGKWGGAPHQLALAFKLWTRTPSSSSSAQVSPAMVYRCTVVRNAQIRECDVHKKVQESVSGGGVWYRVQNGTKA